MKPGVGPVFDKPLATPADVDDLTIPDVKVTVIRRENLFIMISPFEPGRPQICL